jgi:hypothetical protein
VKTFAKVIHLSEMYIDEKPSGSGCNVAPLMNGSGTGNVGYRS